MKSGNINRRTGLAGSSVLQFEPVRRNPTLQNLEKLANRLDVEPFQLLLTDQEEVFDRNGEIKFRVKNQMKLTGDSKQKLLYHIYQTITDEVND